MQPALQPAAQPQPALAPISSGPAWPEQKEEGKGVFLLCPEQKLIPLSLHSGPSPAPKY